MISKEISSDQLDELENYFFESSPSPWTLIQKKANAPYLLIGYFENHESASLAKKLLFTALPEQKDDFTCRWINKEDWQNAYKDFIKKWHYKSLHWIPLWEKPIREIENNKAFHVYIDAGMAFGTGAHETTQLCAQRLVDFFKFPPKHIQNIKTCQIVDAGCGSGILALSASCLGFEKIYAFDNDPDAIDVCKENACNNPGLNPIVFSVNDLDEGLLEINADFLMANIQTNILIPNVVKIIKSLKQSSTLILSGILNKEISKVKEAYMKALKKIYPNKKINFCSMSKGEWSDLKVEIIACEG